MAIISVLRHVVPVAGLLRRIFQIIFIKEAATPTLYLDDANLLEEVSNFLNSRIFSKSLYENGVVVRVILLPTCGENEVSGIHQHREKLDWVNAH